MAGNSKTKERRRRRRNKKNLLLNDFTSRIKLKTPCLLPTKGPN